MLQCDYSVSRNIRLQKKKVFNSSSHIDWEETRYRELENSRNTFVLKEMYVIYCDIIIFWSKIGDFGFVEFLAL